MSETSQNLRQNTTTIASGKSLSAPVDFAGAVLGRVSMPASWTAASLTFQVSRDGFTYSNLMDAYGGEYTVIAAANQEIILDPRDFLTIRYIRVRSGTSASPVNQGAARDITLVSYLG